MTSNINFSYPFFIQNQVLRSENLNNIVNYLDEQNRLTRTHLFGIGIVYGLNIEIGLVQSDGRVDLNISDGIGISSKGFFYNVQAMQLNSWTPVEVEQAEFLCDPDSPEETFEIWELFENGAGGEMLNEDFFKEDKVIILLWDQKEEFRTTCFNDRDNIVEGEVRINIRKFAVTTEVAEIITKGLDEVGGSENQVNLPAVCLNRFGYTRTPGSDTEPGIFPEEIVDCRRFLENYESICVNGLRVAENSGGNIAQAYIEVAKEFPEFFEENQFQNLETHLIGTANPKGLLQQVLDSNQQTGVQYFYDYLKDLVLAYEEFTNTDYAQIVTLRPDPCLFPYHISLGRIFFAENKLNQSAEYPYRTNLIRPPIEGQFDQSFRRAKRLAERMINLTKSEVQGEDPIVARFLNVNLPISLITAGDGEPGIMKITPSKGKWFPLSERAIPFYYLKEAVENKLGDIRAYWSFEAWNRNRQDRIPAFYPVSSTNNITIGLQGHLLCDVDAYNFFRIEGHLNRKLETVLTELNRQRKGLNLPFDIRCVKLDLDRDPRAQLDEETLAQIDAQTLDDLDKDTIPDHSAELELEMKELEITYQENRSELRLRLTRIPSQFISIFKKQRMSLLNYRSLLFLSMQFKQLLMNLIKSHNLPQLKSDFFRLRAMVEDSYSLRLIGSGRGKS